jgi:peptidoglycan hydrolase CwlO-like protein
MGDWPLNDSQMVTAAIFGLMLVVLIVIAFRKTRVTRKEFARLQKDVKRLSDDVRELQMAEQRRFLKELKTSKADDKPPSAAPDSSASASQSPSALRAVE